MRVPLRLDILFVLPDAFPVSQLPTSRITASTHINRPNEIKINRVVGVTGARIVDPGIGPLMLVIRIPDTVRNTPTPSISQFSFIVTSRGPDPVARHVSPQCRFSRK
jgi:hypothetical protein